MSLDYLKQVQGQLADLQKTLEAQNDIPTTAATAPVSAVPQHQPFLDPADRLALRQELRTKSTAELNAMFTMQAGRRDTGVPFSVWAATGGNPVYSAIQQNPILTKALDTSGAAALIRQDLEPILYELYIREFPYWERIRKEPANGLVHAFDRQTTFGDAVFMGELGTVTDDTSAYERATTPVSILATRRGVSLKAQFAVPAGGMSWNPEQLELQAGLRAIAHKMQKTIFQGNATATGSSLANTEFGEYDANAFTGFRQTFNTSRAVFMDPASDNFRDKMNTAITTVMQLAGRPQIAYMDPIVKGLIDIQQDENVMYVNSNVNIAVGVTTNAINTVMGPIPLAVVPGDSIGYYTRQSDANVATQYRDIYLLDESTISVPYLGSDGPTVLDIPIGISGQLTHLYIIFGMWGLAVKVVQFSNKIRVKSSSTL